MKIGVSMWSYFHTWRKGGFDVPAFIREAKRAGADGVELLDFFYNDPGADRIALFTTAQVADRRKAAQEALAETGLPIPIFSVANNFAKHDPAERQADLNKIKFGVDEALLYGAKVVRVFAGDVSETVTFDQAREYIVDGLAKASVYAHQHGIRLALENHGTLAGRGEQVCGLIEDVRARSGNDALGANPDTGNFLIVNQPSHEAIREVARYANMVHFKDFAPAPEGWEGFSYKTITGDPLVGTAVGEGVVKLGDCIQALKDAGFDGWLSVEYEGEEDPLTAVPRSIENARKFL
ncbi:MAG TPA: sugar phosphate isomerase/epimerase family protein [Fimbriimonadaceae bacterium]|nr:sugar phosphate isomerase/epimerase family protein [Fimbriimonadaceae bacterium]